MSKLKEALFILKGGKYVPSCPEDCSVLAKHTDADKFEAVVNRILENPDLVIYRKKLRIVRCLQLLAGSLMLGYALFFAIGLVVNLSPGSLSTYEMLYLGFCGIMILFFAITLFMIYAESRIFPKYREKILKALRDMVAEEFIDVSFLLNLDRSLTIRARPLMMGEEEEGNYDPENMDYYDYINYNNPESEEFYTKQNPYELDPHERNTVGEIVRRREMEAQNQTKVKKSRVIELKVDGNK
jgi:hypothetical protein